VGSRQTRYVKTVDGVHIAYQAVGDGAPDIAFTPGFISNVDEAWDEGGHGELFRSLSVSRISTPLAASRVRRGRYRRRPIVASCCAAERVTVPGEKPSRCVSSSATRTP